VIISLFPSFQSPATNEAISCFLSGIIYRFVAFVSASYKTFPSLDNEEA